MSRDTFNEHRPTGSPQLFRGQPIISDQVNAQELAVICHRLERMLASETPGSVVEFGCYAGTTSLFIRRVLDEAGESEKRQFHVYDSFEGLPPKSAPDSSVVGDVFEEGKLYVSKKEFLHQFRKAGLEPPVIHKAWFEQLSATDLPKQIAFAFLDGDFYSSIMSSLALVYDRMSPGGLVLIDDYGREALPGVTRAVDDFFKKRRHPRLRQEGSIAVIMV